MQRAAGGTDGARVGNPHLRSRCPPRRVASRTGRLAYNATSMTASADKVDATQGEAADCMGGFQVLYQAPAIYQLSLPQSVAEVIESLAPIFNIGVDFLTAMPLECMGVGGFLPELIVHLILPPFALMLPYPLVASADQKLRDQVLRRSS